MKLIVFPPLGQATWASSLPAPFLRGKGFSKINNRRWISPLLSNPHLHHSLERGRDKVTDVLSQSGITGRWIKLILCVNVAPLCLAVCRSARFCVFLPVCIVLLLLTGPEVAEVGVEQNAVAAAATRLDARLKVGHDLYCELRYLFIFLFGWWRSRFLE